MIGRREKAILHIAKKDLALDDEVYRDILEAQAGVRSSVDLDRAGYNRVLSRFKELGFSPRPKSGKKRFQGLSGRPGMATPAQLRKIEAMWITVSDSTRPATTLRRFLFNRFRTTDLRMLTTTTASKVIEALKAMQQSKWGYNGGGQSSGNRERGAPAR